MTQKDNQPTLSQFLQDDKTQLRLFDMGRRVSKLGLSEFEKFEKAQLPYPYPYQQTAWVGLLFWNSKDKNQHNIWFVRFPLDEQGLINLACRDEFMDLLFSRIADNMQTDDKEKKQLTHALKDNFYSFKPTEENMAIFNAKAKITLQIAPSHFYNETLNYLTNSDYQGWGKLGLQGFADIAVRQHEKEVNRTLCKIISLIPLEPFCALCNALENEKCTPQLADELVEIVRKLLLQPTIDSPQKICSALRAISSLASEKMKNMIVLEVLNSTHGKSPIVLVIIAAKLWESLSNIVILKQFLENLSLAESTAKQKLFDGLIEDLIFIPRNRQKILNIFRDPHRSNALSNAIGAFFNKRVNEDG